MIFLRVKSINLCILGAQKTINFKFYCTRSIHKGRQNYHWVFKNAERFNVSRWGRMGPKIQSFLGRSLWISPNFNDQIDLFNSELGQKALKNWKPQWMRNTKLSCKKRRNQLAIFKRKKISKSLISLWSHLWMEPKKQLRHHQK